MAEDLPAGNRPERLLHFVRGLSTNDRLKG
jgi:hypothetical protein